jgi:VWFA-related protein
MNLFCAFALGLAMQFTVPAPKQTAATEAPAASAGPLVLDVNAVTGAGKPVSGLTQQDFAVKVDTTAEPIHSFRAVQAGSSSPVETILLVDAVNTSVTNIGYEREQIDRFLKANGGKLAQPIRLAILTDTDVVISPHSSTDGNQLAATLDKTVTGVREFTRAAGFYGWTEQFQISAAALERIAAQEQARPGRKLLIWVSPGWPLLSGPEVQLTRQDQQKLFATLVSISSHLRRARITLSSVDPLGTVDAVGYQTTYYQAFEKGVPNYGKMQVGDLALQVLALHSGGQVLNSSNDIAGEIARAASDAEAFYTLTVDAASPEHGSQYHSISVDVNQPGVRARTETGYYAQP